MRKYTSLISLLLLVTIVTATNQIEAFKNKKDIERWVRRWTITSSNFENCNKEKGACCFVVGEITSLVEYRSEGSHFLQFSGNSTCSNNLVFKIKGKNSMNDLFQSIGNDASGDVTIVSNMDQSSEQNFRIKAIDNSQDFLNSKYAIKLPAFPNDVAQNKLLNVIYMKQESQEDDLAVFDDSKTNNSSSLLSIYFLFMISFILCV